MGIKELSRGLRDFLAFLESDPMIRAYAVSHRRQWKESKHYLVEMAWKTYYYQMDRFIQKKTESSGVGSRGILHALYSRLLPCRGADICAKRCRRRRWRNLRNIFLGRTNFTVLYTQSDFMAGNLERRILHEPNDSRSDRGRYSLHFTKVGPEC